MTKNKNLQVKKNEIFLYVQFTFPDASIKNVKLKKKPSALKREHLSL